MLSQENSKARKFWKSIIFAGFILMKLELLLRASFTSEHQLKDFSSLA